MKRVLAVALLILVISTYSFGMGVIPKAINAKRVEEFYKSQVERDPQTGLIVGTEPFYYPGTSNTAILLIHGLTGSPFEMKELGKYLNARGYTTWGILLAGHGTSPIDLEKRTWTEWGGEVEGAISQLREHHQHVIVCGLCMGSHLAALSATRQKADGLVMLSPILFMKDSVKQPLILPAKLFWSYFEYDKGKPLQRPQAYKFLPLKSLSQLLGLNMYLKAELPKITVPTLIIASKNDPVPDPKTPHYIFDHIRSAQKNLVILEKSGHVITEDIEKDQVFKEVESFIKEISNSAGPRPL